MPREKKHRGRREENKRKRGEDISGHEKFPLKRHKTEDSAEENDEEPVNITVTGDAGSDFIGFELPESKDARPGPDDTPFYGLLTQEEQDYYANVSNKLDANDFESEDDRKLFVGAVHRETKGKELKVASSQSSSRYLEKVIAVSEGGQLRSLLGRFLGNLTHLVQHRFASHVCETLFLRASGFVGREEVEEQDEEDMEAEQREKRTMEILFLLAAEELQPNMGFLLTDRFASHVVRVLMLVLSGESLDDSTIKTMLGSRKKEVFDRSGKEATSEAPSRRAVPASFKSSLDKMITSSVSGLNTTYLRALATHPTGNPVLQLLLRLELTLYGKSKAKDDESVFRRLLPDDIIEADSESAKFIQGLIYDPTGSRLIETIVQYAPGKTFKKIYKDLLKDRIGSLAKNDTASYVAIRVLERLGKEDLEAARDLILPEIPALIERYRVGLIRVLVERCTARKIGVGPLADSLGACYGNDEAVRLLKMLKLDAALEEPRMKKTGNDSQLTRETPANAVDLHGSLLAQSMLQAPAPLSDLVYESLLALPERLLLILAKDPIASHIIQRALTAPTSTLQYRRKLMPRFFGHMAALSVDPAGSHLADAMWEATSGAHFMKERLAKELQEQESVLRESRYGRSVWKNWSMDLYNRRFQEWQAQAKGHASEGAKETNASGKSAIELARERHAAKKARGFNPRERPAAVRANG